VIDYETVRRNRVAEQPAAMSDWDAMTAEQVKRDREAYQLEREAEAHTRDLEACEMFCQRKAEDAERAGNSADAGLWDQAAETIKAGKWPVHRRLSSDPEIVKWQGVRTRLLYLGKGVRIGE